MAEPSSSVPASSNILDETNLVQKIQNQFRREQHPMGENFDALVLLEKEWDKEDEFLIFSVNNRNLNGKPSFFPSQT